MAVSIERSLLRLLLYHFSSNIRILAVGFKRVLERFPLVHRGSGGSPILGPELAENGPNWVACRQAIGPSCRIMDLGRMVQAEPPEDRGRQIARGGSVCIGPGADLVARSKRCSAAHAAAGQADAKAVWPMVAAAIFIDAWRTAEFSDRDDQR